MPDPAPTAPADDSPRYRIRGANICSHSEVGLITNAWLRGYRHEIATRRITDPVYYHHHHKLIERLWDRPSAIWLCAVDYDDPAVVYAFLCGDGTSTGPVVHWIFTKATFRRYGLASALIRELERRSPAGPLVYTHTARAFEYFQPTSRGWLHNPYVLWYDLEQGWQK